MASSLGTRFLSSIAILSGISSSRVTVLAENCLPLNQGKVEGFLNLAFLKDRLAPYPAASSVPWTLLRHLNELVECCDPNIFGHLIGDDFVSYLGSPLWLF